MEAKQIARQLGTLSIEERVQIIGALLQAYPEGLQMLEIAARTELNAGATYKQLDSLMGSEMVSVKSVDNNKIYFANFDMLEKLFDFMYHNYGPGLRSAKELVEQ